MWIISWIRRSSVHRPTVSHLQNIRNISGKIPSSWKLDHKKLLSTMPMLFTSESPKLAEESRGVQMRTSVLRSFVRETCSTSQTFKTPLHSTTLSPLPSPTLFIILQDVPEVCINPLMSSLSFRRSQCVNWGQALTRHSALTKTAVRASRTAFRPAVSTSLRAASARFASDSALHGKIHQG